MTSSAQLAKLTARLAELETAYSAALSAQEYSIAGRSKKTAELATISREMDKVQARINRIESGCGTSVEARFTPHGS